MEKQDSAAARSPGDVAVAATEAALQNIRHYLQETAKMPTGTPIVKNKSSPQVREETITSIEAALEALERLAKDLKSES